MPFLTTLFTLILLGFAIVLAGPLLAFGAGVAVMLGCGLLWFLPFLFILFSDRAGGLEKLGWILLMIFFSWFAWPFYFLLAPICRNDEPSARHYHYYVSDRRY